MGENKCGRMLTVNESFKSLYRFHHVILPTICLKMPMLKIWGFLCINRAL